MGSHARRALRQLQRDRQETLVYPGEVHIGYVCPAGHRVITAAVDRGNLPDTLGCRHEPGHCGEQARREAGPLMDVPDELLPVRWEWHKPSAEQLARFRNAGGPLWLHVNRGGLVLRRRRRDGTP